MAPRNYVMHARNRFADTIPGRPMPRPDLWDNYQAFRAAHDLDNLDLGPELFANLRDRSSGWETAQHDSPTEIHP
jgi:hypothetical protein